jgi:hypothetical protein
MGKNSIQRGSTDTWTPKPHRYAAIAAELGGAGGGAAGRGAGGGGGRGAGATNEAALWAALHRPDDRDPRAYIIPSSQADFATATRFVNALLETGIDVRRATREFSALGKTYPAGSYVVQTAQAFRPHVIDMFEPQDHPTTSRRQARRRRGRTTTPAGRSRSRWASSSTAPSSRSAGRSRRSPIGICRCPAAACRQQPHRRTRSARRGRRLCRRQPLARGERGCLSRRRWLIPSSSAKPTTMAVMKKAAAERGAKFTARAQRHGGATKLARPRVGLWDMYGGAIDAGWAPWIPRAVRLLVRSRVRAATRRRQLEREV